MAWAKFLRLRIHALGYFAGNMFLFGMEVYRQDKLRFFAITAVQVLIVLFAFWFNNSTDTKEDLLNERTLLASQRVMRRIAFVPLTAAALIMLGFNRYFLLELVILYLLGAALAYGYSARIPFSGTARRIKEVPLAKTLYTIVGWTHAAIVVPWVAFHHRPPPAILVGIFALTTFCGEVMADTAQSDGDRSVGVRTLPVIIGRKPALLLSLLALLVAWLISLMYLPSFWTWPVLFGAAAFSYYFGPVYFETVLLLGVVWLWSGLLALYRLPPGVVGDVLGTVR